MASQFAGVLNMVFADRNKLFCEIVLWYHSSSSGGCKAGAGARPPRFIVFIIGHVLNVAGKRDLHVAKQWDNLQLLQKLQIRNYRSSAQFNILNKCKYLSLVKMQLQKTIAKSGRRNTEIIQGKDTTLFPKHFQTTRSSLP